MELLTSFKNVISKAGIILSFLNCRSQFTPTEHYRDRHYFVELFATQRAVFLEIKQIDIILIILKIY